ncbi:uncharacterized protein DUF1593 [Gibbsiella quercinecans]|uniref:DUF1593 domain-containing protein n=1 Tax=Gibbsiella quercinecans TaxID=929813 RepID=A0A250B8N4_9GAMM|nr:DUF1593 domain-containing protein [Gibbsiella quercinecans]ATA22302.1 hypothetical protein AWC35_02760 [Gibbsiella quercinecans]RLM13254.1 hypothetical protein BIY31_01545 [Gibbsiella quercinecans]RLM14571.1 hypothetical protein BIY30_02630 [Gibbsiella quercinecans]TCT90947.1 uncharacterized protein DUF1593 [Gibbsiella quercinecans]
MAPLNPLLSALLACTLSSACALAAPVQPEQEKTRILILSDIGNEPDDSQSLVRFLVYSNEFNVEGLIATTSTWLRDRVNPEMMLKRIDAYELALPNLRQHAAGYPSAAKLRAVVRAGRAGYGMDYVGSGKSTAASALIIQSVDKPDTRPLWINVWGGAVDLAQALYDVRATRSAEELDTFVSKIRVYAISDQDNTGEWIRAQFPTLRYITSIHAWNDYFIATWSGMSSRFAEGGDMSQVNNSWLDKHIRNQGPLGAAYPAIEYTMEGDTPSFLYLLQNGLNAPEHPEYGGWGGRYAAVTPDSRSGLRTSTSDTVMGIDGKNHRTASATIWRWREAYQNDFAARMQWSVNPDVKQTNHNPQLVLNGQPGRGIVTLQVKAGAVVKLTAQGSHDVDNNRLSYRWWQYKEPTATAMNIHFSPELKLEKSESEELSFTAPAVKTPTPFHIILQVQDDGTPSMFSYRRAIVTVTP